MNLQAAIEALFSDEIMTHFYTREGFTGRPLEYLVRAFDEILDNFSSRGKRALNILEIGAGRKWSSFLFLLPFDLVSKVPVL